MSTCGFCGEKTKPMESHISTSMCIKAYKERLAVGVSELYRANTELSQLRIKLMKLEDAKDE